VLRLDTVGKRYGRGGWVLRDVTLEVRPGTVVAVAGANGSGKSTLLRTLVGVSRPTRGRVTGRPETVGYVPDRFPPNERLSATAYLTHLGRIRGLSGRAASARAGELLDRLRLVGGTDAQLRTLSRGNAQKVALAQAVLLPPGLLVLDEPWSGLDMSAHGTLSEIIAEVAQAGGAVVFTDHRESVIRANASHSYRIAAGRLAPLAASTGPDHAMLTEVVLHAPGESEVDWYGSAGVVTVTRTAERTTILVTRDHCDALLLTALRAGHSVRGVGQVTELPGGAR
jgi:ABC-type multidrug transport system ATPase subunit